MTAELGTGFDDLVRVLKAVVEREYAGCEYATLVVHVADGVPALQVPVITPERPGGGA